ncbi:MAG: choice-of-anchor D domain-containing protein, partial [Candidatus Cloacimonadales bacterium]
MKKFTVLLFLIMFTFLAAEWTIVETFNIPGKASGLAWDGEYLYSGIYGVNGSDIYQIDPSDGSYQLLFSDPELDDTYGLTYDGEYLWLTDHRNGASQPAVAYQYDFAGNILAQFDLPDHYMSGLAYDQGNFWAATYYPDGPSIIYQVDNSGNILQQLDYSLPSNSEQPWDLCLENGALWVADYDDDALHKLDTADGTILESQPSENIKPSGVVFDGTYLWYVDGELSSEAVLYKVDLGGGGTPDIATDWQEYDFGFVTVGNVAEVDVQISNNGTADLVISELQFSDLQYYHEATLPQTIAAGATETITLYFAPDSYGAYPSQLEIFSNDPLNPQLTLQLAAYGLLENPTLVVEPAAADFGSIRTASSRSLLVDLSNQGSTNLEISDIIIDDEQFYLDDVLSFESVFWLGSADTLQARIWFYPSESGTYQSEAAIYSNDPDNMIFTLELQGSAVTEDFSQGQLVWQYQVSGGYDNSIKAIRQIEDITGDNHHDLIVTSEDYHIRAFNGNSDSYADLLWELEIPGGNVFDQKSLEIVEDLDGDGYQDIIIGTGGSDRAVRAISGKTGEMILVYQTNVYGSGGVVYQVEASQDFTDDGVMDVLAASGNDIDGTGPQRIFLFDGSVGTVLWDFYAPGPKFSCLAIEDVNGDGIPDAIGAGSNTTETTGMVYGIDEASGNQIWEFSTAGTSVWALQASGDLNADGINDIILGDFGGNLYALDAALHLFQKNLRMIHILFHLFPKHNDLHYLHQW